MRKIKNLQLVARSLIHATSCNLMAQLTTAALWTEVAIRLRGPPSRLHRRQRRGLRGRVAERLERCGQPLLGAPDLGNVFERVRLAASVVRGLPLLQLAPRTPDFI